MPRGKKRTPKKASLPKEVSEEGLEESSASQECENSFEEPSKKVKDNEQGEEDVESLQVDSSQEADRSLQNEEETSAAGKETAPESCHPEGSEMTESNKKNLEEESEKMEQDDDENGSQENLENEASEPKKKDKIEDMLVTPYMPHSIPDVVDGKIKEKWEWHMKIYPIDQSDIRRCVLDSVSKIAQETWFYIDKKNYGMGSYDLCMRNYTDAAMVMLKTLHAPMLYRYVTIEVTRRGKNPEAVEKIKQSLPASTNGSTEEKIEESEDHIEEAIEKLPYSEVLEKATLHLDFLHTVEIDKTRGKQKRSLYVKNLPESTSKELLKVLFPVAINLDFISTAAGRRVGDLDVVNDENLRGVLQAYVTMYINGCKSIGLGWKEEDLDNKETIPVSDAESPWQLLPRDLEVPYEAAPEIEEDEAIQYHKRKRELETQKKRAAELQMKRRAEKRRESRWDGDGRRGPKPGPDVRPLQKPMKPKFQDQLNMMPAVGDGPPHSRGPPPMMGMGPDRPLGPMDAAVMRDRKRDRFERDRMDMEMPPKRMPRDFPPFGADRRFNRMGPPDREFRGRPDFGSPRDRDRMFEGNRGRGGGPMGMFRGRGGRFDQRNAERGMAFEGRFGADQSRMRQFDRPGDRGRGRGGGFDMPSRDRGGSGRGTDSAGRGGGAPSFGRGMSRGAPSDQTRNEQTEASVPSKVSSSAPQMRESGAVERVQSRDQRSGGRGGQRNKPISHGFPSNFEKPADNRRTLTQVTISSDSHGSNKSFGPSGGSQKQSSFGNRSGYYNNQRNNSAESRPSSFGQSQNQNRGFGSQNQQSGFGLPQNQQNSFNSQNRQNNFGSPQNRQNNFGNPQNQQRNFGSSQNQQRGFGGSQTRQSNFGSGYQQSNFGSTGNQSNFGGMGNQSSSFNSSTNRQTGFGSTNQQSSFLSSQNQQQTSFGSNQPSSYLNSTYGTAQTVQPQQSSFSGMQTQSYGGQQSYSTQQSAYGSYNTQQQQQQQQGYGSMQQQPYNTSQSFDAQQQSYSSQGYNAQQQQSGYSSTGAYDWNQQASAGLGSATASSNSYSQNSYNSQQTLQQDYSAYSQQGQSAYSGYGSSSVPSTATGYGADSAFANHGLYSSAQGTQGVSDPYGTYSASDAYSYAQYQGSA
ncbi:pentatricopeptide repeat-containing protein [Plakobranchus ocellatus]|uniref:Pentatricopeptide repeat-containing protein n=1 Tax=Plakobranchus ocellatus TaxID=259542 RepID=A0AAV3ZZ24_9GAST|nr:pentatricopeptide repeat-containing protein [Plakobranchus ocellatus]